MRLTVFLILFGLLRLDATTYAQNMKVNLECKDVLLSEVMEILKEQTKLDFFYSNKELDVNNLVDLRRRTRVGMGTCQGELCAFSRAFSRAPSAMA